MNADATLAPTGRETAGIRSPASDADASDPIRPVPNTFGGKYR